VCPYCDFAVEVGRVEHERYLDAVLVELAKRSSQFAGDLVSIYFGGGTPSLWRTECLERVVVEVCRAFPGEALREVTLEANPTDCTEANLAAWAAAGINRLSIGIQSTNADELLVLGRDHRFGDGPEALQRALASKRFVTSCDFILGTPSGSSTHVKLLELQQIAATRVDHLSVYELTIEEGTAFGKRKRAGTLVPLDEDVLADLYVRTHDALTAAGFEHYEISSYARPGRRAVHNSLYWSGSPFLGLGVGAASLAVAADGSGVRTTNPRRAAKYLADPGNAAEVLSVSPAAMRSDRAWLAMRTSLGVAEDDIPSAVSEWMLDQGLAERNHSRICPTLRGFMMADRIAARIAEAM
jgi:oxygen-independent coproporphyrinogen-3 oxidase